MGLEVKYKSLKWRSGLKELEKLIKNMTHFYLKAEFLRLFSPHENTSKIYFCPDQNRLMLGALLKWIAKRNCCVCDQLRLVWSLSFCLGTAAGSTPISKASPTPHHLFLCPLWCQHVFMRAVQTNQWHVLALAEQHAGHPGVGRGDSGGSSGQPAVQHRQGGTSFVHQEALSGLMALSLLKLCLLFSSDRP